MLSHGIISILNIIKVWHQLGGLALKTNGMIIKLIENNHLFLILFFYVKKRILCLIKFKLENLIILFFVLSHLSVKNIRNISLILHKSVW